MEEEGGNKIQNLYGSFTFHVKLCFQRRVHWWDGWKKEANSIEEEDAVVVCYSTLEAARACIGQTINGRKIVGIRVVRVENYDALVGVDTGKEETQVESAVDFQDEEGADWSEVAEQGSLEETVALEGSADGMALAKIARHSHVDYEPMDLDEEVPDERRFSDSKKKRPLMGAEDNGHRSKRQFQVSQADMVHQLDWMDVDDSVNVVNEQLEAEKSYVKEQLESTIQSNVEMEILPAPEVPMVAVEIEEPKQRRAGQRTRFKAFVVVGSLYAHGKGDSTASHDCSQSSSLGAKEDSWFDATGIDHVKIFRLGDLATSHLSTVTPLMFSRPAGESLSHALEAVVSTSRLGNRREVPISWSLCFSQSGSITEKGSVHAEDFRTHTHHIHDSPQPLGDERVHSVQNLFYTGIVSASGIHPEQKMMKSTQNNIIISFDLQKMKWFLYIGLLYSAWPLVKWIIQALAGSTGNVAHMDNEHSNVEGKLEQVKALLNQCNDSVKLVPAGNHSIVTIFEDDRFFSVLSQGSTDDYIMYVLNDSFLDEGFILEPVNDR